MAGTVAQYTADNTVKPTPAGSVYPLAADTGLVKASFAQHASDANAVQFTSQGKVFNWQPDNVAFIDDQGNLDAIYGVAQAQVQAGANRAVFVGTTPLTSDEWVVGLSDVKHNVRVEVAPRTPAGYLGQPVSFAVGGWISYDTGLKIWADGAPQTTDFTTQGNIEFREVNGDVVYTLPRIFAKDTNGQVCFGGYKVAFNADGSISFWQLVDWAWMEQAAYPVTIDPTVVVSSAYDTSGNGGRKMVHLSNGWIVAAAFTSAAVGSVPANSVILLVSKDNGTTWSQLCWLNGTAAAGNYAIASSGTTIYAVATISASQAVLFYKFDATTVSNANQVQFGVPDTSQSSFGSGISPTIDGNGYLLAAWCSKNSTYPNSFNIRYGKSTDGGTTWTVTQISGGNTSGDDTTNPCIVVRSNNNPTIIAQEYNGGVWNRIFSITYTGTAWGSITNVYLPNANYAQSNPCAAVDSNDVIFCGWDGADSTTSNHRARWSKSTDGGATWSAMALINPSSTNASTNVSFVVRPDNSVDAFWQEIDTAISATYTQIRRANLPAGSSTWSAPVTITNNTTANAINPQTLWSKFNMNSSDALRYIWGTGTAVDYDSISLNSPPNAPTNLAPTGGSAVGSLTPNITGTFSDPDAGNTMSAIQVKLYRTSDNTLMWDSTKTAMTTTTGNQNWSIAVPGSANLAWNTQYYYTVSTWDNSSAQGAWSANQQFLTEQAPTVTLTSPTASQSVTQSSLVVSLSYSQANNVAQGSYQFKLFDSTGTTLIQDSGAITGNNNQFTFNGLANNTTYKVVGYATTKDGVQGTSATVTFSTSFTATYAPTVPAPITNANTASVAVNWTNPAYKTSASTPAFTGTGNGTMSQPTTTDGTTAAHSFVVKCTNATVPATFSVTVDGNAQGNATVGTQYTYNGVSFTITAGSTAFAVNDQFSFSTNAYTVQYNRLYKQVNSAWVLTQDQIPTSTTSYTDYLVANGAQTTYGVSAMGTNGVESTITSVNATLSFSGDWLYDPVSGQQFQFLYDRKAYDMGMLEERKEYPTFGKTPMIRRGPLNARKGTLEALMVKVGTGQTPMQQLQAFEAIYANHPTFYLKTAAGEVIKVDVYNKARKMPVEYLNPQAIGIAVDWTEVA